jgi:hypothetical protein
MRIGPPTEMLRSVLDFLDAHLYDHAWVRADPRSARRDIAQHRIEHSAGLSSTERIDPHQHTVCCEKLLMHFVGECLVKNRRLSANAEQREFLEDPVIAIILWRRGSSRFAIAAAENRNTIKHYFHSSDCLGRTDAWRPC